MYMTNLYAYDKKLYLIKDRLSGGELGVYKTRAIARGDIARYRIILGAYESCRERREKSFYICSSKQMKKKETIDPLDRVYRFTRSIGNKFIRCFSLRKCASLRKYFLVVALISFNLIIIHFP